MERAAAAPPPRGREASAVTGRGEE